MEGNRKHKVRFSYHDLLRYIFRWVWVRDVFNSVLRAALRAQVGISISISNEWQYQQQVLDCKRDIVRRFSGSWSSNISTRIEWPSIILILIRVERFCSFLIEIKKRFNHMVPM